MAKTWGLKNSLQMVSIFNAESELEIGNGSSQTSALNFSPKIDKRKHFQDQQTSFFIFHLS